MARSGTVMTGLAADIGHVMFIWTCVCIAIWCHLDCLGEILVPGGLSGAEAVDGLCEFRCN
jgi:hypothetical protein